MKRKHIYIWLPLLLGFIACGVFVTILNNAFSDWANEPSPEEGATLAAKKLLGFAERYPSGKMPLDVVPSNLWVDETCWEYLQWAVQDSHGKYQVSVWENGTRQFRDVDDLTVQVGFANGRRIHLGYYEGGLFGRCPEVSASTPLLPIPTATSLTITNATHPPATPLPSKTSALITAETTSGVIEGRIYAWVNPGYYFTIEQPFYGHGVENNLPNVLDPTHAIKLAFAPYSEQVAYLTINEQAELWVANLDLSRVERVWRDETSWLGANPNADNLRLTWGPQDKSVILISQAPALRTLIYHLPSQHVEQFSGVCDQIGIPPTFQQVTLACVDQTNRTRLLLPGDGSEELSAFGTIPATSRVQSWAFSPDGGQVVYAAQESTILVSDVNGKTKTLLVTYEHQLCCGFDFTRDNLQWSQDGKQLLVYGKGPGAQVAGWHVLDAATGTAVAQAWADRLRTPFDAILSPNGLFVLTSYIDSDQAYRYMALVSLLTGEVVEINEGTVDLVKWDDAGLQK